ncbi:DUF6273 domain-containing protein [Vagococcus xieshaowenii]|uniref:DUF6273 domain-containing protein n=1 Tax=Vagococcus xieshaowenii TaxID=2562451 RepID=UPI0014327FC5|nr:DUF6273 domain-containing protein [Vagococcus xieshaowenii]
MKRNHLHKKIGVVGLIGLTMGSVAVQGISNAHNAQPLSADEVSAEAIQSTLATSELAEQLIQESHVTQESSQEAPQSTEETVEVVEESDIASTQTSEEASSDVTETTVASEEASTDATETTVATEEEETSPVTTNEVTYEVVGNTLIIETARLDEATKTDAKQPEAYSYFEAAGVDIASIETIEIKGTIELIDEGGAGLFSGFTSLKTINGLDNLNTKEATSLANFFKDSHALTSLDLSVFNTEKITDMKAMFEGLDNLIHIRLGEDFTFQSESGFDTLNAPTDTTGKWSTKDKEGHFNQVPVTNQDLVVNYQEKQPTTDWYIVEQLGMTVKEATIYQDEDVDPGLFIDSLTDGYGNPSSIEAQDVEIKNVKAVKTEDKGEQDITLTYASKGETFEATTELTVKDITDGLSFTSLPETVSFGQLDISDAGSYPASITGDLKVTDNREDLEEPSWHVQASMVQDLTNEAQDNHVLNQHVYVQTEEGKELINSDTSAIVYSQEASQSEEKTVELADKLTLDMKASEAKTGTYSGTVLWTLADGPGNEIPDPDPIAWGSVKRLNLTKDDAGNFTQGQAVTIESDLSSPTYSLENATSKDTTINDTTGELTVGLNEQVGELIVRVTSGKEVVRYAVTIAPFETNDIINQAGIDWKIMKDSNNEVLMVTDEIQKEVEFNPTLDDGNDYTGSTLEREMQAFYEERIAGSDLGTFVSGVDLPNTDEDYLTTINGNNTPTAFALTNWDVTKTKGFDRVAYDYEGERDWWWLRSPRPTFNNAVRYVDTQGTTLWFAYVDNVKGLRPALYLNLVSDIEQ